MSKPPVLFITKGATVSHGGREYTILNVADLNLVLAREESSGEKVFLKLDELGVATPTGKIVKSPEAEIDLTTVDEADWEEARLRLEALRPLMSRAVEKAAYRTAAETAGVSVATIYRWLRDYRSTMLLSSLLPVRRGGGAGKGRLPDEVEALIDAQVQGFYLTPQKPSVSATVREIRRLCSNAGLSLPSRNAVTRRIEWITGRERTSRRHGEKRAREDFDLHKGSIPDAEWPLSLVQMDHTLLPVIIVDEQHRKPINRAWVTFAIDVFSRACLGMHLSLDPPSAMSSGLCVAHAILPKEQWINQLGLESVEWPFYGTMDALHLDNAREFRGDMLKSACSEYDIDIHLRPVKKPHYGAHIERLMGTVSESLKTVRGATFSGPKEKGEYDAEGNACMTLDELEKWLALMLAGYHQEVHAGIGTSPKAKWREGILGTKGRKGRGIPLRRDGVEEKVRLDFMPYEERTVQEYGVLIDVHYWHDVLRPWINAPDPEYLRHRRKFKFRRDPRDISQLYFFDPDLKRYIAIPYRDSSLPPVSIWELRAAKERAKNVGIGMDNEREVFALINQQREIEAEAAHKTKVARRAHQQRVQHQKVREERKRDFSSVTQSEPTAPPPALRGYNPDDVAAYEDEY